MDEHFRRGDVGGHRDCVHIAQPQQGDGVGFIRPGADRIAEKQQHIHLAAGDHRGNLLGPAARAGIQAVHGQAGGFPHNLAGHAGGDKFVFRQNADIGRAKLGH